MSTPAKSGVLAIDLGRKKSGFAACDPLRISTTVLEPVRAAPLDPEFRAHLETLLSERSVDTFLVSLPLDEDGTESRQAGYARDFALKLAKLYPTARVLLYDERYTSKEAEHLIREAQIPRAEVKRVRDSFAALVLLRDWLDSGEPDPAPPTEP